MTRSRTVIILVFDENQQMIVIQLLGKELRKDKMLPAIIFQLLHVDETKTDVGGRCFRVKTHDTLQVRNGFIRPSQIQVQIHYYEIC